jgi:UDP-glucose:(heptosyl)LPS alpha-1,3-glucosyltransferase
MKLALVYHQLVAAGGLENYLIEFSRRLAEAGHELTFVTSRINAEVAAKLKGEVKMLRRPKGSATLRLWQFSREAAQVVPKLRVDRVLGFGHTVRHDVHRAGGGCHAHYSELLPFWKRYGLKNLLALHLERQLYTGGETTRFVTNSNEVTADLSRRYGPDSKVFSTIHTAVEGKVFRPAEDRSAMREAVCRELKTDVKATVLLFVSLSHWRKGLDGLIEAMAELPEAVLWVVGKGLNKGYLKRVEQLGIGGRIRLVNATNQLVRLYQAADWFVHPTRYDACANTVLQSMACGLPGLISVHDGAIDHVRHGQTGFLLRQPQEPEVLRKELKEALSMSETDRQKMGLEARAAVEGLTWDRHVRLWEELLGNLP